MFNELSALSSTLKMALRLILPVLNFKKKILLPISRLYFENGSYIKLNERQSIKRRSVLLRDVERSNFVDASENFG